MHRGVRIMHLWGWIGRMFGHIEVGWQFLVVVVLGVDDAGVVEKRNQRGEFGLQVRKVVEEGTGLCCWVSYLFFSCVVAKNNW